MSERLRRISIIGVCLSALLAVVILPLQAGANSKPAAKPAVAKPAVAKTAAQKAKALKAKKAKAKKAKAAAARRAQARKRLAAEKAAAAKKAAAAAAAAKRAAAVVTTTQPPVVTTTTPTTLAPVVPPVVPPVPLPVPCVGQAMTNGQADINAAPAGTTFCLSGTHNWSLIPKSGDQLIGPAVLDGGNSTQYAIQAGTSSNVVLSSLEIRNYTAANQRGAIVVLDQDKATASGWQLLNLSVHDNGTSNGGAGATLGNNWQVLGGRYFNNRQEGIGGAGTNAVINGAELDHNTFTTDSYTSQSASCASEGGGIKFVATNVTITNSKIHDNACKGIWTDGGTHNAVITNNQIYNNWSEGVMVEISSGATITGNTIYGNGFHVNVGSGNGCAWLWGGGITIASSDHTEIAHNTVTGNCNGITGTQQNRPDGNPGLLEFMNVHDNTVSGPVGKTGVVADNGANLTTRSITFANNTASNGMLVCALAC